MPQTCVERGIKKVYLQPCQLEEVINACIHGCPEILALRKKERQNKIFNLVLAKKKDLRLCTNSYLIFVVFTVSFDFFSATSTDVW